MDLAGWLFALVIVAELVLLASLALSIARPAWRTWPPAGRWSRGFWWSWGWTVAAFAGAVPLAFLDYGSFVLDAVGWRWVGGALVVLGAGLSDWGVRSLTQATSAGLGGVFRVRGPYRWVRNPQYIGHALVIVGLAVGFDSTLLVVGAGLGVACLVLAVHAEERWLEERYGAEYAAYRARVPRWLPRPPGDRG